MLLQLSPFILPVLCGSACDDIFFLFISVFAHARIAFDIRKTSIASSPIIFALISRRSRYRAGTRYFRRGVDHEGHVANFNETEQIVVANPKRAAVTGQEESQSILLSFVQTRGSVPVYWAEINNLRYAPDLQVMEQQDTVSGFSCHFQHLFISILAHCNVEPFTRTIQALWASDFG
jgi:hypothetical protein